MSPGQTGHTPGGVPPKFFMFIIIGFFLSQFLLFFSSGFLGLAVSNIQGSVNGGFHTVVRVFRGSEIPLPPCYLNLTSFLPQFYLFLTSFLPNFYLTQRAQRSKKFDLDRIFQSRSRFLISLENFNLDVSTSPQKIGPRWVARSKISFSIEIFTLARNLDFF